MSWILKNNGKILEDICLDPQTVEEEVLINGAIILDSYLKSVTFIRGLGMNTDRLHRPVNVVANEIVANITISLNSTNRGRSWGKSRWKQATFAVTWI